MLSNLICYDEAKPLFSVRVARDTGGYERHNEEFRWQEHFISLTARLYKYSATVARVGRPSLHTAAMASISTSTSKGNFPA